MKWLKKQAELYPQKQFLNDSTFAQINQEVNKMAEHLAPLIDNQSRVALLSENSVEMAVVLFALLGLSKEVLLLNIPPSAWLCRAFLAPAALRAQVGRQMFYICRPLQNQQR